MNKKLLGVLVILVVVAMLTTPMIGNVMAGKGQEKLSFKLVMIGHYTPPEKVIETENTIHYQPLGFLCNNPLTADPPVLVEIDGVALPDSRIGGGIGFFNCYSFFFGSSSCFPKYNNNSLLHFILNSRHGHFF
jgi:hypothetical protein